MKKPKILYVTLYLPIKGIHGGGNRMFEQIKYLSAKYDIHLISFVRGWEENGVGPLKQFCAGINTVSVKEKRSKSYSFTKPGFIKNYYSREMDLLIQEKTNGVDFDIAQFEYLPMAQYSDGLKAKVVSVLVEHQLGYMCLKKEMDAEKDILKKIALFFRHKRLLKYESDTFEKFDRVIFISGSEQACARRSRSFVSPMGVDTGYFRPSGQTEEDFDLIYIGNFDSFQNEDSMVYFAKYIWPLLKKKRPGINMKIIGIGSKEKLTSLRGMDGIDIMGHVEDIRGYLSRAKVFVVPARIGGGMRGKLLEAMSMGKPVVSTSVGAEGYSGSISQAIKIADTPGEFADKTVGLLSDNAMREGMGCVARQEAEKGYSWEHIFSEMDMFYEGLLIHG